MNKLFVRIIVVMVLSVSVVLPQKLNKKVTVVMPDGDKFEETYQGLLEDASEDFIINRVYLTDDAEKIIKELESINPDGIVLMENKSIKVAKLFQEKSEILKSKPIFPLMALQVEQAINGLNNVTAIKFEIPAYTIFSNIKFISKKSFKYVFVLYRKQFQDLIDLSKKMVAKENLQLEAYCLDCDGNEKITPEEMLTNSKKYYQKAKKDGKIDIAWMLADNVALKATLANFWVKDVLNDKIPYVAPLDKFVENDQYGGMMAFNPDYRNLGSQLAGKLREILEDNEGVVEENSVEELISVFSVLNKKRAESVGWELREENLSRLQKTFK